MNAEKIEWVRTRIEPSRADILAPLYRAAGQSYDDEKAWVEVVEFIAARDIRPFPDGTIKEVRDTEREIRAALVSAREKLDEAYTRIGFIDRLSTQDEDGAGIGGDFGKAYKAIVRIEELVTRSPGRQEGSGTIPPEYICDLADLYRRLTGQQPRKKGLFAEFSLAVCRAALSDAKIDRKKPVGVASLEAMTKRNREAEAWAIENGRPSPFGKQA
jgi:hypothetical protein